MLRNLDFRTNGVPQKLKIDDTPYVNLSDKAEDRASSKTQDVAIERVISTNISEEVSLKEDIHDEVIQQDFYDIDAVLKSKATEVNSGSSDKNNLVKIKSMLKEIKKMLKQKNKKMEVDSENFKSYVPISEDVENPESQGMGRMTLSDGLNLINRGRKTYDIV